MDKDIINFLNNRNVKVTTKNKARGHLGFFCNDKIAISKNLSDTQQLNVLIHEFAHKIHSEIEPSRFKSGGNLSTLFCYIDDKIIEKELLQVTNYIDINSRCLSLENLRQEYKSKVLYYENLIKHEFPDFAKSKKFIPYEKYQKKTKCKSKYFLKYDHVKIVSGWFFKNEFYSVENIEKDFPDLPENFKNYFYLLSNYRKQKKVQNKIAKLKRYYKKPTELFARFVECFATNSEMAKYLAPTAYSQFEHLLDEGYYNDLKEFIELINSKR